MKLYIHHYIRHESLGGLCLILAAVLALLCANSSFYPLYHQALQLDLKFGLTMGERFYGLSKPLILWINDVLMSLFFLLVGLEIKRELIDGELSTRSKALQPFLAAIGGMLVPAMIYAAVNLGDAEAMRGWAIPCATDIAFALGVLALLGSRVPVAVKIMLTAIAIIDDLLSILVIAFFYTRELHLNYLWLALFGLAGLVALNRSRSSRISLYLVMGSVIWWSFLKTGVHPTLAAVVTAMAIPLNAGDKSPLVRLEHALHGWVIFFVLPIFAFANSGLPLGGLSLDMLGHPVTLGIILGLAAGKPLGIMGGLFLGHVSNLARKPAFVPWSHYLCMSVLCGIGFTMALFIGELAFDAPDNVAHVKLGILAASLFTAVSGWFLCRLNFRDTNSVTPSLT